MELIILMILAVEIQANRLLQQFTLPVDGGCSNPPPSFSCNIDERCCDIGNGASCCKVNLVTPLPPVSISPVPCNCITLFNPVCCNGKTYGNDCEARCHCTGTITNGACEFQTIPPTLPPGCAFTSCPVGFSCCSDGNFGAKCCPLTTAPSPPVVTLPIIWPPIEQPFFVSCSLMRCGIDGKTECYDKPGTGQGTCCAPDALCTDKDYSSSVTAVCLDDGTRSKYENKCFGRCDGYKACGALCSCETDADCGSGEECLSDGICAVTGQSCGGFVGLALCNDDEICVLSPIAPGQQPVGNCYSLPEQCTPTTILTPAPVDSTAGQPCGLVENCRVYSDGCNSCDCGENQISLFPRCTMMPCRLGQVVPNYCTTCVTGYKLDKSTGQCIKIPSCGGIDYCTSYKPDPCNTCGCGATASSLEFCTMMLCAIEPGFVSTCNSCIDGYQPSADGKTCEKIPSCGGIDKCTSYTRDSCLTCQCSGPLGMEICPLMPCPNPPPELQGIKCNACIDGYRPSADGSICEEIASCGGIARCLSYKPDPCNTCGCGTSGGFGFCTRAYCGDPSLFPNQCTRCETGYVPNADGSACVEETATCCEQLNGFEDVMRVCGFEGCQCCPDGTWSGSIGDGRTFCGGLILGQDKFGTVCGVDVETKKICNIGSDCNRTEGFRCRRDPICRVNSDIVCQNTDKVCVDYSLNNYCSFDYECETFNGYKCLTGNNVEGYCVKYQANVV